MRTRIILEKIFKLTINYYTGDNLIFSPEKVQRVWEKSTVVQNYDPNEWRKDQCRAWMYREYYGRTDNIYGWEVDHIKPKTHGGTDDLSNLRPLQWDNNRAKDAGRTDCVVTSQDNKNVRVS